MNSKGIVGTTVHWVFIAIASVLIITFATAFVFNQNRAFANEMADSILVNFQTIIQTTEPGTATDISLSGYELGVKCRSDCDCLLTLDSAQRSLQNMLIFGPDYISGSKAILWSEEWLAPFRSSSFLFVANSMHKYFLVSDDSVLNNHIISSFPDSVPARVINFGDIVEIDPDTYDQVHVIFVKQKFLDKGESFRKKLAKNPHSVIEIEGNIQEGNVTFFKAVGWGSDYESVTYQYFGKASLIAAILASESEMYECQMRRALERLGQVSRLYSKEASLLDDSLCVAHPYSEFKKKFDLLSNAAYGASVLTITNNIKSQVINIEESNEIMKQNTCPMLY